MKEIKRNVTIRINDEIYKTLKKHAFEKEISMSKVIETALEKYFATNKEKKPIN